MASNDPSLRRLARQLVEVETRLNHLETVPQLAHSSLDDHGLPVFDADGRLTVTVGKQPDGTWGAKPVAGPVPPQPVGLDAEGDAGTIRASWQGVFWAGAALPMDFEAVQVLVDGSVYAAIHDPEGGSVSVPALPGERLVSFRTLSQAGVVSEPVLFGQVTVDPRVSEQMQELGEDLSELRDVTLPELSDELDDARTDLQSKLDAANQRIDDIIVDGGGSGNFTTYSINEPSGEGTGEGDQWFRVVNGEVLGQWRWDGAAWQAVTLTDAVIAGIDLSKLISSGNLSEVVANKMFTDIFTANKITSQEIAAGSITTEKIAAEGIIADVIQGGSFVGESFEGGEFTGGLFKTSDDLPGQVLFSDTGYIDSSNGSTWPGIRITPPDALGLTSPPGIGPNGSGMVITGGQFASGERSFIILANGSTQMRHVQGDSSSNVSVGQDGPKMSQDDGAGGTARIAAGLDHSYVFRADGAGNESSVSITPTQAFMARFTASGGQSHLQATANLSRIRTIAPDGSTGEILADSVETYLATYGPGGDMLSTITADGREAYLWSNAASGVTRILSVDTNGVWVKTNKSGSWKHYNLEETAQDSGWNTFPVRAGFTGNDIAWRNKGGICHFKGNVSGSYTSGWNTLVTGLPEEMRPSQEMLRMGASSTTEPILRMTAAGDLSVRLPSAWTGNIHLSPFSYVIG